MMKTIQARKLSVLNMGSNPEAKGLPTVVKIGDKFHRYMGIGWVEMNNSNVSTEEKEKAPTVVYDDGETV